MTTRVKTLSETASGAIINPLHFSLIQVMKFSKQNPPTGQSGNGKNILGLMRADPASDTKIDDFSVF